MPIGSASNIFFPNLHPLHRDVPAALGATPEAYSMPFCG